MTDFSAWGRPTLEALAAELVAENKTLTSDLKTVLAAHRKLIMEIDSDQNKRLNDLQIPKDDGASVRS